MLSLLLFILLAKEPASICLVLFVCRIQWDSLCGKGRGRIGMLIGLFTHGLAIKKLLVTLSLSAQCNHRATDKVIITVCAERLKSPLNYAQFKLARALEGVMDKLLLPLRYHCYVVCMITLGGEPLICFCVREFIPHMLVFTHFNLNETYCGYFWKWKTATVFAAFTWTLHKPAGSTVQSIISRVGGCEMRQEEGTGSKTKDYKKIFSLYLFAARCRAWVTVPKIHDKRLQHIRGLHTSTHPATCTDLTLTPAEINCALFAYIFLARWLPQRCKT